MVQCGICLEEYQEGDLELHRQMCEVRLMFRCSLCDDDYVNKEGLWNHLDLHEIADEIKELHYQEIKAKYKLHQCVLCNDQRAYSEISYWKHVHDIHDGFFLRCSDCGESFRSEKLKNDHASSRCKAMDPMEEEQVPIEVGNMTADAKRLKLSLGDQSSNTNEGPEYQLSIDYADKSIIDKGSELPTINLPSRFSAEKNHKINRFKVLKYQCPHCKRKFHDQKKHHAHRYVCEQKMYSCKLCGRMFKEFDSVKRHNKRFHPNETSFKNIQIHQAKKQMRYHKPMKANFQCPHCSRKFRLKNKFEDHAANCANLKHSCELCGQRFNLRSRVEDHKKRIHLVSGPLINGNIEGTDPDEEQNQNRVEKIDAAQDTTVCNICRISFANTDELMNHKKQVHKATQKDTEPRYECAKCSMKFHYIKPYKSHLNVCDRVQSDLSSHKSSGELIHEYKGNLKMTAGSPLKDASCTKCSHCGIEESSAVTLTRHILIHHDPVACDFCGITLSSFSQAQHHMKTKHKDSQLKCPHCSRRFNLTVRLQKHVSKCEKEIIPCEFCGTMFENATAVNEHKRWTCCAYNRIKEHEQKTSPGARTDSSTIGDEISMSLVESSLSKTKCLYCYEEFPSPEYLVLHLQTCHELTKCDICGITVIGLSCNKRHKLICQQSHEGPKYVCQTCGKKFHSKTKYNKHCFGCEIKMYSCKLCGKTVKQFNSVKQHLKRYHPDESNFQSIQIVQDQKQVQNIDLDMEITVEGTTISARDDQGLSLVNPSSDVLDSRSDGHSLDYSKEDEIMDSQVIDKESQTVSVAPLNFSSKRQVVSEEISQPLDENLSNQPYFCNICGITMHKYSQFSYHRATKHKEGRHQCPNCSRKFYCKSRLESHVSCCASLKQSCELCGQKFKLRSRVDDHKKRVHHGSRPLRDANIEGADCTEEKKQGSVENKAAAEEMISCIVCRISFASTDELMKHKLNCPKHSNDHDDSQFSTADISLLHGVSEAQADSTIVPLDDNVEIKLEIEVEETMLQEQEFQVPNENSEKSSATALHPDGDRSKDDESEDADDLENEIKVKLECFDDEEETIAEHQARTISNQKTGAEVIGPANLIDLGYVSVKSCSFEEAKLFVKTFESGFGLQTQRINNKGSTRYYRCLRFKQSARPQCERKVLMFTPNGNEKTMVCVKGEHSCINAPPENLTRYVKAFDSGYTPVKTCSIEVAESFVKNFEFGFSYRYDQNGKKGKMRYYLCSRIKKCARPQCQRRVLICTPYTNEESTVYAKGEHSCMNAPPENLTRYVKAFDSGYAPVKTCSIEVAESFVKNFEFGFGLRVKHDREKGNMRYYHCIRIKRNARPQCERKVLICTPDKNKESTVYAKGEHSCTNAPPENLKDAQIDFGYAPIKTCSTEDAKSFVKNFEFGFGYRSDQIGKKGKMQYYVCSRIKREARLQCQRRVLICTPYTNEESTVYAKGEHSCMNAPPKNSKLVQIGLGYALVKRCSFEDAKSFVENFEYGFAFHEENAREKGNMRYYRCSRNKQQIGPQCKRTMMIFTPDTNEESLVYAQWEHNCTNAPPENMTLQAQIDFGYIPVKTCSIKYAKSFVENFEFGFSFQSEIISKKGRVRYYRCLRFKQSARPQCERKLLICTPDTNEESTVCAKGEHSCINAPPENLICLKAKPSVEQADIELPTKNRNEKSVASTNAPVSVVRNTSVASRTRSSLVLRRQYHKQVRSTKKGR